MTNIQPIVFPLIGTGTKLNVLILNFETSAISCNTYYQILTEEGKMCVDGNYQLTEQEFDNWGRDNSYIDEIIANNLGITIIP
jgi:hypothetical protein